ncbi:MAG: hypothetical protein AB1758_04230 [Candidatus Eremiobacterota bacterium]
MPSRRDSLTNLLHEEYLEDGLDDEMSRARRFGRDLSLLLLEPIIPERLRPDMLYVVLKSLARTSAKTTRQVDVGVRWGQQLLYVLPETSEEGARVASNKIADQFAHLNFQDPSSEEKFPGRLRSSIVVYPRDIEDRKELLERLRDTLKEHPVSVTPASTETVPESSGEEAEATASET